MVTALTREELWTQLKSGQIAPVYTLYGPETFLRDKATATIVESCFRDGDFRDFNENRFSLNAQGNLKAGFAVARQLPMMAAHRVVMLTDVRISMTGHRDTITEDDEPLLTEYFDNPSPSSTVIFIADELNGNRKMGKLLRTRTTAVEFSSVSEHDLMRWAADTFKKLGAEIDMPTLREFVSRVGLDVRRITNEATKVATAALPAGRVTPELVEQLVPLTRDLDHFELTRNLVAGRRKAAIHILRRVLDEGAEPLALLGMINYNYRRLLMAKDMMERGASRSEVQGILKMRYNDQEPFLAAARRVEMSKLSAAIRRMAQTDVAIKSSIGGSGPAGARLQVEMLVCELALL